MPPILILALVGAVLALLTNEKATLPKQQQEDLEKLQKQLAEARKSVRFAESKKRQYIALTGAKPIKGDK